MVRPKTRNRNRDRNGKPNIRNLIFRNENDYIPEPELI